MKRSVILSMILVFTCGGLFYVHSGLAQAASKTGAQAVNISQPVVLENSNYRAVFHLSPGPDGNQGGGSLYELYYKPGNPNLNLIAYDPARPAGWPSTATPIWFGIGGSGDGAMYASAARPAAGVTNGFNDFLTESNIHGKLVSNKLDTASDRLAVTYDVYNGNTRWYSITKVWTLRADGLLLDVTWRIRKAGWFSEPAMRFKFQRGLAFDSWRKYGTPWNSTAKTIAAKTGLLSLFPADGSGFYECWCPDNQFIADWAEFTDSPSGITMRVSQTGTGLNYPDAILEQSVGQISYADGLPLGEYAFCFADFWGGNPPTGERYRSLAAGTTWQHGYFLQVNPVS